MRTLFRTFVVAAAAMASLLVVSPAQAAGADYLLQIDGIPGDSSQVGYEGFMDLESWSFGATNPAGTAKVKFNEFTISKTTDKASPKLFESVVNGKHHKQAVLTALRAGERPQPYLVVTMSDVLITGFQAGAGGGAVPQESVTFVFGKIAVKYIPQNEDGSPGVPVETCWDVKANRACR